ncbi:MAG: YlbF family regulator [Firmicutes bacterium]|jgi:cell fate (sporulation/competence/biofilm development) regulator YlbF (YheA/YmcA/DUF963 family)|nr:YlbF family regulator [Bacillota bacterium]
MDVRKKAQELADAIVNAPEYQRFITAREEVNKHQAAQVMLQDFQNKQLELHKQQMEGKPVTESQEEQLRKLYEVISVNPYIRDLFEAEFMFSGLMLEINDILSKALKLKDDDDESESDEEDDRPTTKLWTPGS